jgi:hypothetical protein
LKRRSFQEELVRKPAEVLMQGEELAGEDDAHDPEAKKATRLCQPHNSRSTSTVFDFIGHAAGSLLHNDNSVPSRMG